MQGNKRLEQILYKIKKNGYSLTPQRYEIIKIIAEAKNHPSAIDIYSQVKNVYPMVSLNTIYKNIAMLLEMHEIREIKTLQNAVRYDGDITPHAHVICKNCREIIDLPLEDNSNNNIPEIYVNPKLKKEYGITGYSIEFYGICGSCAAKERQAQTVAAANV